MGRNIDVLTAAFLQPKPRRVLDTAPVQRCLALFQLQDKLLTLIYAGPVSCPPDQAIIRLQLLKQSRYFVFAAVQQGHIVLLGETDVDAPITIRPAVADRKTHTVQQKTVEHLCLDGHVL